MSQVRKNSALLLTARWGRPTLDQGGPLNIIAKLLTSYSKMRLFEYFGFLSANHILTIPNGKLYTCNDNPLHSAPTISHIKKRVSNLIYANSLGHSMALDRDRRRLKAQIGNFPFKPNIIHSHNIIYSGMMFPDRSAKTITTIHYKGSLIEDGLLLQYPYIKKGRLNRRYAELETNGILSSDLITFPSYQAKKMFDEYHPAMLEDKHYEIVYNGIDMEKYPMRTQLGDKETRRNKIIILNVASMSEHKRFDIVLEVVKELLRRGLNIKLIHIGDGPMFDHYRKIVQREMLNTHVEILGTLNNNDVIKHVYTSHIHFLPSERVVFDLISLEAMAGGLPSVLSDDGGNKELIQSGMNGILVPKGNIQLFAGAIQGLIENSGLWSQISINGRKTVESKFTQEIMATEYKRLYELLLM